MDKGLQRSGVALIFSLARALPIALALCLLAATALALDLQGHRGARGLAPENTLPSFEAALRHGVSTLELDIAITSDGVLVVHHDLALNPAITRDERGQWLEQVPAPITTMSWAELQRYDVGRLKPGSSYARPYPDQQPADGTRVPRLADLFELVKRSGNEAVRFAIEIKTDPRRPEATRPPEEYARLLLAEIDRAGMRSRVQILSFDWRGLQAVQRLAPGVPTVYLSAQQRWLDNIQADVMQTSPWTAGFAYREHGSVPRMIKAAGGGIWSVHFADLDAAKLKEARALGIKVLVWTVNDTPTMERMLDLGVDGLITDRPDLARQVMNARGLKPQ